jgi:hypothetical protein
MTLARNKLLREKVIGQAVGATGFEPDSEFLASPRGERGYVDCEMCRAANALHSGCLKWLEFALNDTDLRRVILAWPSRSDAIRRAILALVDSSRTS